MKARKSKQIYISQLFVNDIKVNQKAHVVARLREPK